MKNTFVHLFGCSAYAYGHLRQMRSRNDLFVVNFEH